MACTVVCISRARGASGEEIGKIVAERLGFLYVDEEIISRAAVKAGIDAGIVADEERRKSLVHRMLQGLADSGGASLWGLGSGIPLQSDELRSEDVRILIRETIEQTAAQGNVVIVAHAASHLLGRAPGVLRVFVTASPDTRATRIGELEGLDDARAAGVVKDSDADRRDYLKRFYDVEEELPTHYDLVVNTDVLSTDQAAKVVCLAVSGS